MSDMSIPNFELELDSGNGVTYDMDLQSGTALTVDFGTTALSGGTTDHSRLINRDAADQHPMSAITGLDYALVHIDASDIIGINNYVTNTGLQTALAGYATDANLNALAAEVEAIVPGDVNVIESISVNGTAVSPDASKNVEITVPTYSTATTEADGLMSYLDKIKLNGIESGAEANQNAFSSIDIDSQILILAGNSTDELSIVTGTGVQMSYSSGALHIDISESDPTVPAWAKESSKPTYTAAEVGAVPTTRTVNSHDLSADITLTASDVGAVPTTREINGNALSTDITLTAADVSAVPTTREINGNALSSDITLAASDVGAMPLSGGTMTGDIQFPLGKGVLGTDSAGNHYPMIYNNNVHLWIGAEQSASVHHRGRTYISAGHSGSDGYDTIYVAVPNAANNGATTYKVAHAGNIYDLLCYANGNVSERGHATGYTTGTSGNLYLFFPLQKRIPDGATISNVTVTAATIRCAGKAIANNIALTSNIEAVSSYMGGAYLNIHLTGLTTNFTATQALSAIITVGFTLS